MSFDSEILGLRGYTNEIASSDTEERIPSRLSKLIFVICFVGLILGISSISGSNGETYHPNNITKAAMGIFLAVFAISLLMTVWLWLQLSHTAKKFQKKLFLAIALASPFLLVRLVYSAISDYTDDPRFVLDGDHTIYLCMNVLEEIIAMAIIMALGMSAALEKEFVKLAPAGQRSNPKVDNV